MFHCGEYLKELRKKQGMSQKELGVAVGFSENTAQVRIAGYENGTRTPRKAVLKSLFEALNLDGEELAGLIADSYFSEFKKTMFEYVSFGGKKTENTH